MPLPAQSTLGWHVSISILHTIAIASTLFRLVHRRQRVDLWWDDWATILPLVCEVLYFVIMWLKIHDKLKGALFTSYWFECILFLTIIWASRTSLALSIARIFPPRHMCHRVAFGLAGIFLFLWIAFTLMAALECYDGSAHEWWDSPLPLCLARRSTSKAGVYIAIACDFFADLFLIVAPIGMLWNLKLPVVQRRLVFVVFSCSILTLVSSAFFVTLGLAPNRLFGPDLFLLMDMGPQLEGSVSIIVCNLMVVATLIYRIARKKFAPEVKLPPLHLEQENPATPTPLRVGAPYRRGTSIFQDFRLHSDGQNRTVMTADVVLSVTNCAEFIPLYLTVAYESSELPTDSFPMHLIAGST